MFSGTRVLRCAGLLLVSTAVLLLLLPAATTAVDRVCHPGEHTFYIDQGIQFRVFRRRYWNCTHVMGNLVIANFDDPDINYDLSFLRNIRYVRGFVAIYASNYPETVSLPRLEIIRGNSCFNDGDPVKGLANISLLVGANRHEAVHMPNLKEVSSGNVLIDLKSSPRLCHLDTINWTSIVREGEVRITSNNATCPNCSSQCQQTDRGRHCWGPTADLCQHQRTECLAECEHGLCQDDNPMQCCAEECAGGCQGPSDTQCTACRDYIMDSGRCSSVCPIQPRHIVNGQNCSPMDLSRIVNL